MAMTGRDLKQAIEFGLIVESRLEWQSRQYVATIHKLDASLFTVHRVVFDQFVRFEWVDKDRDVWDRLELTQIELDCRTDGFIEIAIELWDVARLTIVCRQVTCNEEVVVLD